MRILKRSLTFLLILLLIVFALTHKKDIPVDELKKEFTNEQSKFVDVDGLETHFRIEGHGPYLVLLHGTASSLHTWDGWTSELKNDFTIVRMDMPAFGITGPNPQRDYSIQSYVTFLDHFLIQLHIDSFYLAGNSLGGAIAWVYALQHPGKTLKLILLDAGGYPKEPPMVIRMAQNPVLATLLKNCTPRFFIEKNIREVYCDDSKITDTLVDRYYRLSLRAGNRQAFIDRVTTPFTLDTLAIRTITTPTLILWGDDDLWIPVEHARLFHRDIQGSKLIIYKGAGHVPMEEIPEATAHDVLMFLHK